MPWKPGQSGNPGGRKVGSKNVSTIVRQLLDQDAKDGILSSSNLAELANGQPTSYAKAIVLAMLKKALEGNVQVVSWLAERQDKYYAATNNPEGLFSSTKLVIEIIEPDHSAVEKQ